MKNKAIGIAVLGWVLSGCSGTTVVLVPDAGGKVGKVTVKTKAGEQLLAESGASTFAGSTDKVPTTAKVLDSTKIQSMFGVALANEPMPPLHYAFYFQTGSADLLPDAKSQLTTIYQAIQERQSCDLSVIGHSDRTGDNQSNQSLSLKRAEAVVTILKTLGLKKDCVDVRYYGENDPVIPTADGVSEPRNRRVEIEVR
jgi:outer membrane protein OmpA-like peptidoglycan-associated protein